MESSFNHTKLYKVTRKDGKEWLSGKGYENFKFDGVVHIINKHTNNPEKKFQFTETKTGDIFLFDDANFSVLNINPVQGGGKRKTIKKRRSSRNLKRR